jgi:uncharacterized membrane protein YraQ (UPF0718 family)
MDKQKKRDRTPFFLAFVALILAGIAWYRGGWSLTWEGIERGGLIMLKELPLLVAAFLIAGLVQTLVSREMVVRWFGAGSGWRGILMACLGGALIPGGPYVYYPIAAALLHSGAGLGVLISFVTAKNLWSVSRLPMEFALLGSYLTLVRFGVTFILPPIMGLLAEVLFGEQIERIREAVEL